MPRALRAALLLLVLAGCSDRPPNLILVSIDTLRADHVSSYGYARETTPALDRLARDGVLFEQAFTVGGATLPSHMSMLTGLPLHAHDVTAAEQRPLAPQIATLAEQLVPLGYRSGAFVGGAYLQRRWGFGRGFLVFEQGDVSFEKTLPRARAWVEDARREPFFLFLHTLDVHSDTEETVYDAPPEFRDRFVDPDYGGSFRGCREDRCASALFAWINRQADRGELDPHAFFSDEELEYIVAQYDGSVAYADHELGRFLDFLRKRGLYEESLILVTSDHGEEFLEHGRLLHQQNFEEVARVPLIVKLPENAHAGARVRELVSLMDVMPTFLEAAGLEAPAYVEGRSLLATLRGELPPRGALLVAGGLEKFRTPRWSLFSTLSGAQRLYRVEEDPGEREDVILHHMDVARKLHVDYIARRQAHEALRQRLHPEGGPERVPLDPETVERLRGLGYLQE